MTIENLSKKPFERKFRNLKESFEAKVIKGVNENDCWDWNAFLRKKGYGAMFYRGKTYLAHRVSFFLHNGFWAKECVCHTCDNRKCTNPKHLFEGSHQDNVQDRDKKGRVAKGEMSGRAKLSEQDVIQILSLLKEGVARATIGRMFGVSREHIGFIKRRKSWKHLQI